MTLFRIKKAAWEAGTPDQQEIIRYALCDLGCTGRCWSYEAPNEIEWKFFQVTSPTIRRVAYLGCLCANQAEIFASWSPPHNDDGTLDEDETRAELLVILSDPGLTHPLDLTVSPAEDDPNPYQTVLDAQSCPNFLKASESVPSGYIDITPYPFMPVRGNAHPRSGRRRYGKNLLPNCPIEL